MNCLESLEQIFKYIDGQIKEKEIKAEIEEHLRHCRRCWDVVMFEKRVQDFIKCHCQKEDLPKEISERAKNILNKFRNY